MLSLVAQVAQMLFPVMISVMAVTILATRTLAQTGSGVSTSYTLVKTDLTVNEPVFQFSVQNGLPDALAVNVGDSYGYGGFRARIIRPDGRTEEVPKPSPGGVATTERISPFATYTRILLVNAWFDFDIPGRYIMEVETTRPFITELGPRLPYPTDGRVTIEVGARDPVRLRQVCSGLLEKVINFGSSPAASRAGNDAAEALAYVNDPVAVPYVARALDVKERTDGPMLVRALERIADGPAVDVLISRLNSDDEDTRSAVRGALARIEGKTPDPMIRLKIHDLQR